MPFTFERTENVELIKSVLCIPKIYEALHDDEAPPSDQWQPIIDDLLGYVCVREAGELCGFAIVGRWSKWEWECHTALRSEIGWKKRLAIGRSFIEWVAGRGCRRLIGRVPAYNQYAIAFNKAVGLEVFGVDRKSWMKNGKLHDQIYMGICLPRES